MPAAHLGKLVLEVAMGLTRNERRGIAACNTGALELVTQLPGHLLELPLLSKSIQDRHQLGCGGCSSMRQGTAVQLQKCPNGVVRAIPTVLSSLSQASSKYEETT